MLTVAVLISMSSKAQPPIAHWMMDGNAADSSGNANHGTMFNVTPTAGRLGKPNTALFFDGQGSSYITVPYNPIFNVSQFSICATVMPTVFYAGNCQVNFIFERGTQTTTGYYGMVIYENAYNNCSIFDSTREVFAGGVSSYANTSTESSWQATDNIHTNTWYSAVLTYNGNLARMYVNGTLVSTLFVNFLPVGNSTEGICIGMSRFGNIGQYPYPFTGAIEDITLYNRVLSDQEIKAYNKSTLAASSPGSLANEVSVFPNPSKDMVTVQIGQLSSDASIAIYNSIGQRLLEAPVRNGKGTFSVRGWPTGNYLVHITAEGVSINRNLVVD